MTTAQRMTAAEFLALPPLENGHLRQLIDGEVVVNAPSWTHGDSLGAILTALRNWVRAGSARGGVNVPVDVLLDNYNVYEPDVVWYRDGRAPRRGDPPPYAVPDIAVEVRSPSTWRYDIGLKKATYERQGVAELWLVDTAADVVLVLSLPEDETSGESSPAEDLANSSLTSNSLRVGDRAAEVLPGFILRVDDRRDADLAACSWRARPLRVTAGS